MMSKWNKYFRTMTTIKTTFTILLTLACSLSKAQEVNHTGIITFTDNKIEDGPANTWLMIPQPRVTYYISYRLSSLFGEPTVFCQAAVILDPGAVGAVTHKKVYEKLRVRDINFFGAFGYKSKYIIECDVGVPAKPFIGSPQEFRQLSKKQKKKYSSFNVTGSPNWESFIHKAQGFTSLASPTGIVMGFNDITAPANYVSSSKAKELYTDQDFKFNKYSHYGTGSGSFIEVDWDFSELERYYAEQKRNKTEEKIANAEEKIDKIKQRAREKAKNNTSGDFWDQPDKSATKDDENKINRLEKRISNIKEQLKRDKNNVSQADKEKRKVDRYLADKQEELENRPKPEDLRKFEAFKGNNGKYGYKNSEGDIVIPAQYEYVHPFNKYGYAYVKRVDDGYCLIDKANNRLHCDYNSSLNKAFGKKISALLADRFLMMDYKSRFNKVVNKNKKTIFKIPCVFPGSEGILPIANDDMILKGGKWSDDLPCHGNCKLNVYGPYEYDGDSSLLSLDMKYLIKIGYADKDGNIIVSPQYHAVSKFKNGKARVGIITNISKVPGGFRNENVTLRAWEIDREGNRISEYKTFENIVEDVFVPWFSFE